MTLAVIQRGRDTTAPEPRARLQAALDRLYPPPPPSEIEGALAIVQLEIIRLQRLQRHHQKFEEREKLARAERTKLAAEAGRRAAVRQALRAGTIAVDQKWFETFVREGLELLDEQRRRALADGHSLQANYFGQRIETLNADLAKIVARNNRLSRGVDGNG
jgi:hypothetical protein